MIKKFFRRHDVSDIDNVIHKNPEEFIKNRLSIIKNMFTVFNQEDRIKKFIVFGSAVIGKIGLKSDLDILLAIGPDRENSKHLDEFFSKFFDEVGIKLFRKTNMNYLIILFFYSQTL